MPKEGMPDRGAEQRPDDPEDRFFDIDRMVNEGLGGGQVTLHNGWIGESTTDTMDDPESVLDGLEGNETEGPGQEGSGQRR